MSDPSLATSVRRALLEARVPDGASMLVACSGGVDSQALLDTLAHLAAPPRRGPGGVRYSLHAHGVDHGLRPEASSELALVAELAGARGIPFSMTRLRVQPGGNVQARARAERYRALRTAAATIGATYVVTAHQLEDRAETVLLRLLRGAPFAGLAVLPVVRGSLLRPLVRVSRGRIEAFSVRRALRFARDPSNDDQRYLRVRVRRELWPLLRALDPRIAEHLAALADEACGAEGFGGAGEAAEKGPQIGALLSALGEHQSSRALRALSLQAKSGGPRRSVLLKGGRIAAWDPKGQLVISDESDASEDGK